MDESVKLAKLWNDFKEIKDKIDNELIPISGYLDVEDPELLNAMEHFSKAIKNHFDNFKLVAHTRQKS